MTDGSRPAGDPRASGPRSLIARAQEILIRGLLGTKHRFEEQQALILRLIDHVHELRAQKERAELERDQLDAELISLEDSHRRELLDQEEVFLQNRRDLLDENQNLLKEVQTLEDQRDQARQALRDHRCPLAPTPSPTPTSETERRPKMSSSSDSPVHFALDKFIEGVIWLLSKSWVFILALVWCLWASGRHEWFSQSFLWTFFGFVCMTALGWIPLRSVRQGKPVLSIFPVAPSDFEQARNDSSRADCNWEVPINLRQVQHSWFVYVVFLIWIICAFASLGNNPLWVFGGFILLIIGGYWLPCWLLEGDGQEPDKSAFTNALDQLQTLPNDDDARRAPFIEEANKHWWRRWYKDDSSWRIHFCELRAMLFMALMMIIPLWGGLRIPAMVINEMHLRGYHQMADNLSWIAPPEDKSKVTVREYETVLIDAPGHPYADDNGKIRCLKVYVNDHDGDRPVIEIAPITSKTEAKKGK